MRQISFLFLLLAACSSCGAWTSVPLQPHEQENAAVRVQVTCKGGASGSASGVLVRPDLVLTAKHVVESCHGWGLDFESLTVHRGDQSISAHVKRTDAEIDLASVRLDHEIGNGFRVAPGHRPRVDERLCFEPAAPDESNTRSCGFVVERYRVRGAGDIRIEGFGWFGNSGSGAWDRWGRLAGIVVSINYGPNQPTFIPLKGGGMIATPLVSRPVRGVRITSLADRDFY